MSCFNFDHDHLRDFYNGYQFERWVCCCNKTKFGDPSDERNTVWVYKVFPNLTHNNNSQKYFTKLLTTFIDLSFLWPLVKLHSLFYVSLYSLTYWKVKFFQTLVLESRFIIVLRPRQNILLKIKFEPTEIQYEQESLNLLESRVASKL